MLTPLTDTAGSHPPLPTRRDLLALGVALTSGCAGDWDRHDPRRFRLSADFEPTAAVWLGYDAGHRDFTAALAAALQPHVKLRMLVHHEVDATAARALLAGAGVRVTEVDFHLDPQALFFVRDVAVFAVGPAAPLAVVDLRWNYYGLPGWCRVRHAGEPGRVAGCIGSAETARPATDRTIARLRGAPVLESDLTAEGGGIEVNGRGLIIANEALVRQRNPGRSRSELERMHLRLPGIRQLIWLPEGLAEDPPLRSTITGSYVAWGTGGHTDQFVRFADVRTVLLAWPDDADMRAHPVVRLNRQRMQRNFEILSRATDVDGAPLRVVKVPMPRIVERRIFLSAAAEPGWSREWTADFFAPQEKRREGDPVMQIASASYLNFVVANGVVVLPDYLAHGTPRATQERVQRIFEEVFPGRQIRFVDAIGANWVAGGPHCATLNEPAVAAGARS
jgi:agmatine deiminase